MTQSTNSKAQPTHAPYILALDVGTSSTRTLLFDATGAAVPHIVSQKTYELNTSDDGEVSVDADVLVDAVAQTIDEALKAAGPLASQIGAVAADTFWHSLIGVDADNNPLMPLITWEDTRPRQAAGELCSQLNEEEIHARTGARLHASYWPAKLRWLAKTSPEVLQQAAQWLSFGEYLHRRLLGRSICGLSMASGTGMLLIRDCTWDIELMGMLGVRPEQFPTLGDLHDSVSGLRPEYASRWPTLRDIPWFPAIGDGAAANIGSGCATEENWALTIGTSSAIRVVVPAESIVPPMGLWLYLVDAKRGLLGGALSEGGNVFAWMSNTLRLPSLAEAEPRVAAIPPDGHGLTILPFISGERSLGWHAAVRATVAGIHVRTTPQDLLRAAVEALAYQLAAVYDELNTALETHEIAPTLVGSGGALLSSSIMQNVIADALNTPLHPSLAHEASARGAALLALEALSVIPDVAQVPLDTAPPILPDETNHAIYRLAAGRQWELYHKLLG